MIRRIFLGTAIFSAWAAFGMNVADAAVIGRPPPALGLVGFWKLDEGTGDLTIDSSGNNNRGVLAGSPSWIAGKRGKALSFDGTDRYVNMGSGASLNIPKQITLIYWLYPRSVNRALLGRRDGCSVPAGIQYHMHLMGGGNLHFNAGGSGLTSSLKPTLNAWNFIAVSYDTSSLSGAFYLNGDSEPMGDAGVMPSQNASFLIGAYGTCGDRFDGYLDEIRVYNRTLSAAEIQSLYKISEVKYSLSSDLGLVGYWPMNEGTSTRAKDFSGSGNNGVLTSFPTNPTWVDGRRGKALNFDGSDDFINLQDSTSLDLTTRATISVWVKLDKNNNTNGQAIIGRNTNGYILAIYSPTYGVTANRNKITWSKNGVDEIVSNSTVTLGRWFHIVATHDNGTRKIYVNGLEDGTGSAKANFNALSDAMFIGKQSAAGWNFQGTIDDLRLYNRALSASEAYALYKSGERAANVSQNNQITNGLVGLWSFNGPDMSGATAYDRSGQGNNGTLTNGPALDGGKVGQALNFDGVDDYVNVGDKSSLEFGGTSAQYTISAWVKLDTAPIASWYFAIASKYKDTSNQIEYLFSIYDTTAQVLLYADDTGAGTVIQQRVTNSGISIGQWHHIVATHNVSTDVMRIYVDGVEPPATDVGGPITGIFTGTAKFSIGAVEAIGGAPGMFFDGLIDEVRIYDRVLTPDEIKRLYNMGR